MKFTFKSKEQGFGSPEFTMEFEVDQIEDVLFYFEQFLRGSGYNPEGRLDFVIDAFNDFNSEEEDLPDDRPEYKINLDEIYTSVTAPTTFNWTADALMKEDTKFTINPSETKVEYSLNPEGKHINLTINEEVTSLSKTICPVCKIQTSTMQNYTCYDKNCGMKS